jgi:hypothetical protein
MTKNVEKKVSTFVEKVFNIFAFVPTFFGALELLII